MFADDKGNNFYLIKEGTCDVMVAEESGEVKKVRTLTAGGSCGELSLLTGNPRSATIQVGGLICVASPRVRAVRPDGRPDRPLCAETRTPQAQRTSNLSTPQPARVPPPLQPSPR